MDKESNVSEQKPSVGRIVHYTLAECDVAAITQKHPQQPGVRNPVQAEQVYPAIVTAVFGTGTVANLVVQLDGTEQHWATSRTEGEGPGHWAWPARV